MTKVLSSNTIKKHIKFNINKAYGKDSASRIIKVIDGYGKREGICNYISGLIYRTWNAVKAIFGRSDWQLARKAIIKGFDEELTVSKKVAHQKADIILRTFTMYTHCEASSGEELKKQFQGLEDANKLNIGDFTIKILGEPDYESLSDEQLREMCRKLGIDDRNLRGTLIRSIQLHFKSNS